MPLALRDLCLMGIRIHGNNEEPSKENVTEGQKELVRGPTSRDGKGQGLRHINFIAVGITGG